MKTKISCLVLLMFLIFSIASQAKVRIKDIASLQGTSETSLIGYGLVVGLEGTGDGKSTIFTVQSLVNMMQRMGVNVPVEKVKVKNVAAVMVTSKISPVNRKGSTIDVVVSSLGDATSLQGGTLLLTPLVSSNGTLYAMAQGPISIGGFNVQVEEGSKIVNNYTLVGRVPNGAMVQRELDAPLQDEKVITVSLKYPDYTTAYRTADCINKQSKGSAVPMDAGTILVYLPEDKQSLGSRVEFISEIEGLEVEPDEVARVVINERTGTIVAGQYVTISPVALAHGNLNIEIRTTPYVSQPSPFSLGKTVVTKESQLSAQEEKARIVFLEETASVKNIAAALNAVGATPRDIIAIFQALKEAGALRAELIIL
jgi:flagellar P-ring protein precursor FlgI